MKNGLPITHWVFFFKVSEPLTSRNSASWGIKKTKNQNRRLCFHPQSDDNQTLWLAAQLPTTLLNVNTACQEVMWSTAAAFHNVVRRLAQKNAKDDQCEPLSFSGNELTLINVRQRRINLCAIKALFCRGYIFNCAISFCRHIHHAIISRSLFLSVKKRLAPYRASSPITTFRKYMRDDNVGTSWGLLPLNQCLLL